MSNKRFVQKLAFLLLSLAGVSPVWACEALSKTELESIFCQIKGQSPLLQNMSIQDFRNNPEQTQRLLLSRPAKKLGVALPQNDTAPKASKNKTQRPVATNEAEPAVTSKARSLASQSRAAGSNTNRMENCSLSAQHIVCGRQQFNRVFNRANRHLDERALSAGNQLSDLEFADLKAQSEPQYLRKFYEEYLMKMLSIGLSEHTLSYTKFVNLFRLSQQEGVDFASRMNKMFDYLKKDKSSLQVKVDNGSAPEAIDQCFRLNSTLIVCDNVQSNWIYLEKG